ncbi:MAG: hypothetical protein K6G85_03325, partial [Eubacterium sp.]|nr:hypothetical protein [Eubacterium sp.]
MEKNNIKTEKRGNQKDADFLREVRSKYHYSQRKFAEEIEYGYSTIANVEAQYIPMSKKLRERIREYEEKNIDKDLSKCLYEYSIKQGASEAEAERLAGSLYKLFPDFSGSKKEGKVYYAWLFNAFEHLSSIGAHLKGSM